MRLKKLCNFNCELDMIKEENNLKSFIHLLKKTKNSNYKILWYLYNILQFAGVIGGYIYGFLNGNIMLSIIVSIFAISYVIVFGMVKKNDNEIIADKKIKNEESNESTKDDNIQIESSLSDKLHIIPVLTAQLESIITQTSEAAEGLISAFMGISSQAKKQAKAVQEIFGNFSVHTEDCNILLQTQDNLKTIQSNFLTLSSFFDNAIVMICGVLDEMKKIDRFAENIVKIGKTTNILALNASIEAANTGEAGRGFQVIASEINALSKKSSESIKEITEINEKLSFKVEAIKQELENVQKRSKDIEASTNDLFSSTTGKISTTLNNTAEKIKRVAENAECLSKDISKVVVSIQFQDITRQRIEHVITPLDMLKNDLIKLIEKRTECVHTTGVNRFNSVTDSLMKQYTMESEREILDKCKKEAIIPN